MGLVRYDAISMMFHYISKGESNMLERNLTVLVVCLMDEEPGSAIRLVRAACRKEWPGMWGAWGRA